MRLVRIIAHILVGVVLAHGLLPLLRWQRTRQNSDALVRWWMLGVTRILNLRLLIDGDVPKIPALFISNHVSWLDVICLRSIVDVDFVAKDDVRRWPLLGGMVARVGTIFLARGKTDTTVLAADRMTRSLRQQRSVLFFPEGTTTDGSVVRPFHPRLFQAAIRTESPVQVVAVSYPHGDRNHPKAAFVGDDALVSHLWALLSEHGLTVKLSFCNLICCPGQDRRALANLGRANVLNALGLNVRGHSDVIAS